MEFWELIKYIFLGLLQGITEPGIIERTPGNREGAFRHRGDRPVL